MASTPCDRACSALAGRVRPARGALSNMNVLRTCAISSSFSHRTARAVTAPKDKLGPAPPLDDPLFLAIIPDAEFTRVVSEGTGRDVDASVCARTRRERTDEQIAILVRGIRAKWGPSEGAEPGPLPEYLAPPAAGDVNAPESSAAAFASLRNSMRQLPRRPRPGWRKRPVRSAIPPFYR